MTRPWMIDELSYVGAKHLDPGFVAGSTRKQRYPILSGISPLCVSMGISAASTVVDLGAGTGRFVLAAAAQVSRVVAVDVSPAMVAVLRDRVARAAAASVECARAGS